MLSAGKGLGTTPTVMLEDCKELAGLPDLGGDQEGSMEHGRAFGLHAQH